MTLSSVRNVIGDLQAGRMIIIVDDEDRENEGDLAIAAEHVTPEIINFMATHARGLICVPMLGQRLDELRLPPMVSDNTAQLGTAFAVSVDALRGATTGISAQDRTVTIQAMMDPDTSPEDLARPGHIFPLRYQEGGVLKRAGQTEAIVDLARLAGLNPAGIICEIMARDGTMARKAELEQFSLKHGISIVSIADLITYRRVEERLIERVSEARVPTDYGEFLAVSYRSIVDANEHLAMVKGQPRPEDPVVVRVHSECLTGDVFSSTRCDCGSQVPLALEAIGHAGVGVFLYMRQEGRGIGIHNKLKAYALQDEGLDTVEANIELGFSPDPRQYGVGAQILRDLGVKRMRLLTNNPTKRVGLESFGLEVVEALPIIGSVNKENVRYIETKRTRMGHSYPPHVSLDGKDDDALSATDT